MKGVGKIYFERNRCLPKRQFNRLLLIAGLIFCELSYADSLPSWWQICQCKMAVSPQQLAALFNLQPYSRVAIWESRSTQSSVVLSKELKSEDQLTSLELKAPFTANALNGQKFDLILIVGTLSELQNISGERPMISNIVASLTGQGWIGFIEVLPIDVRAIKETETAIRSIEQSRLVSSEAYTTQLAALGMAVVSLARISGRNSSEISITEGIESDALFLRFKKSDAYRANESRW